MTSGDEATRVSWEREEWMEVCMVSNPRGVLVGSELCVGPEEQVGSHRDTGWLGRHPHSLPYRPGSTETLRAAEASDGVGDQRRQGQKGVSELGAEVALPPDAGVVWAEAVERCVSKSNLVAQVGGP